MRANDAEAPRGLMTERREALDAIPADEPHHDLRPSLQLLVRWWSRMHQCLQALEAQLEALESGGRRLNEPPTTATGLHSTRHESKEAVQSCRHPSQKG
jgi:hypothetical protein